MLFARRPLSRHALSSWLIAIAVAIVGLLLQRQPAHLIDPVHCPGLLEWLAITASRSGSRTPVATFLAWLNGAGVFLTLVVVTRWIQRAADAPEVTATVSLAAAVTIVRAPALAPSDVLAVGAASAAWLTWTDVISSARGRLLACLALALTAAIVPALALPLSFAAAWLIWHVSAEAGASSPLFRCALAAIGVFTLPLVQSMMISGLPGQQPDIFSSGCLIPRGLAVQNVRVTLAKAFEGTGPAPLAFALVGVFGLRHQILRSGSWPLLALGLVPMVAAAGRMADPVRAFAPTIAAFWWIVAAGTREIVATLSEKRSWQIGAWILVIGLPVLQWTHRSAIPTAAADEPRGHDALSRRTFSQILGALPAQSAIVIDDAITAMLWRGAATTEQIAEKRFNVIPPDGRAVERAATAGRVYAMPRAQFDLQHRGLIRVENAVPGITGIAAFERASACAPVDIQWQEARDLARSSHLALVADRPDARGPVVIYLGSSAPLSPHPYEWPEWSLRGYFVGTYDFGREADRQRLDVDGVEDRPPRDHPVFGYPYVTRLDLWRVPNGPMILPVGLGRPPDAVLVRGMTPADQAGLRLCPSFPGEIERLEPGR